MYARLSETYDTAESVPTQLERGSEHATRRGWTVAATFKDDGYFGFKEITRDGFGELIAAIEAGQVNVVIVRDIDRLTRNLTDWNAHMKKRASGMASGCRPIPAGIWTCPLRATKIRNEDQLRHKRRARRMAKEHRAPENGGRLASARRGTPQSRRGRS